MESKPVRRVNVIPVVRLKRTILPEDDDCVACRICSKTFVNEVALKNHGRTEHIDAVLGGQDLCAKRPGVASVPKKKEAQDRGERGKRAKAGAAKEKQPRAVTGPFECLQPGAAAAGACHRMFFSCCEYSAHLRDEHTRRRKGVKCQVCEKPLGACSADRLPYTCRVCFVGFARSMELSDHVSEQHAKTKPFECTVCGKRFTQKGGLAQHTRGHLGDKPFACTFCPKSFTQKSGLEQHLRIHTKEKPYRCVVCAKAFCQSVHLQQHMRTHTNNEPFHCTGCRKRFKQSSHLKYHLKYHNPCALDDAQVTAAEEVVVEQQPDDADASLAFEVVYVH